MGQEEVINVLEKFKKPMSASEIAKELNQAFTSVSHIIQRIIKVHEIKIVELNREQAMKRYKCKRRMRLYYV